MIPWNGKVDFRWEVDQRARTHTLSAAVGTDGTLCVDISRRPLLGAPYTRTVQTPQIDRIIPLIRNIIETSVRP